MARCFNTTGPCMPHMHYMLALAQPEFCVDAMRRAAPQMRELLCDALPVAYPTGAFGESVWAAFFGGEAAILTNGVVSCTRAVAP